MSGVSKNGDESERSGSVAPDGGRARDRVDSSESDSSSSEDERFASPPPNKRRKYTKQRHKTCESLDPRVDNLMAQVNYITSLIAQNVPTPSQETIDKEPGNFLVIPKSHTTSATLSLGEVHIDHGENKIIPPADPVLLKELDNLQQFNSPAWKGIRYKKAMQSCLASPGFTGLKLNEEFCHLNKSKDYLASTEMLMASLSNVVLNQRHLIQKSLQNILDWASTDPANLNINNLFEKFSILFGPGSEVTKNSELTMQMICGKRAECIEARRGSILKEIENTNLKATLLNIPPSSEHLFSREALQPLIHSLGGPQTWLNTPTYLNRKRPHNSVEQYTYKKSQFNRPTQSKNTNFKDTHKNKFETKKPFRRNKNIKHDHPYTKPKQN